jgi:hypothetical protein
MHAAVVVVTGLVALIVGWIAGACFRASVQADMLTRASALYKGMMIERNAAIGVLSRVKEELAQLQGDGRKRVVLAEDLSSVRKLASMPENVRTEEKKIVGG